MGPQTTRIISGQNTRLIRSALAPLERRSANPPPRKKCEENRQENENKQANNGVYFQPEL